MTLKNWTVANSLGLCVGFLFFFPGEKLVEFVLPAGLSDPSFYRVHLIMHIVVLTLLGVTLGSFQAAVLRSCIRPVWPWVVAASLAFVGITLFELIEPKIIIGDYPGPIEPIMIALGGGGIAGFLQWLYLRWLGINVSRWLAMWIVGLIAGILVAAIIITLLGLILLPPLEKMFSKDTLALVSRIIWLLVYGGVVGATAGLFSHKGILAAFDTRDELKPMQ